LLGPWPENLFAFEPTWARLAEHTEKGVLAVQTGADGCVISEMNQWFFAHYLPRWESLGNSESQNPTEILHYRAARDLAATADPRSDSRQRASAPMARGGVELAGVTVLVEDADGRIVEMAIHHRPLNAALRFSVLRRTGRAGPPGGRLGSLLPA
jgi:hypothetical protein